jgi:hypothetical protein
MKTSTLNNLIEDTLLRDIKNGDLELADALLTQIGYDIDTINNLANEMHKRQYFHMKSTIQKQKEEQLMQQVAAKIENRIQQNIERPVAYLKELFTTNNISFQHRNLEKLSIDEIKEMIKEVDLLQLIEQLENGDETKY